MVLAAIWANDVSVFPSVVDDGLHTLSEVKYDVSEMMLLNLLKSIICWFSFALMAQSYGRSNER